MSQVLSGPRDEGRAMAIVRYMDLLVLAISAPIMLFPGVPVLGYVFGAGAWVFTRFGADFLRSRAMSTSDPRVSAALHVASMLGRVWLVALAILGARFVAGKPAGLTAALLLAATFTVYLLISIAFRDGPAPTRTP